MDAAALGGIEILAHLGKIIGVVGAALVGDADALGVDGDIHIIEFPKGEERQKGKLKSEFLSHPSFI